MAIRDTDRSVRLNRSSPEPLYRQISNHLEDRIRSGSLTLGEQLESEGLLAQRFQVSRITIRQAVEELVRKGILVRKQGKGTFVTAPIVKHDLKRSHGLLGSLFSQAKAASARLLRYELTVPSAEVSGLLGLDPGQSALALDRLYLIGGRPIAFAQAWLVPEVAALPRLKADLISTEDMMREAGIRIVSSEVAIRADSAGAALGRLLRISARTPVLVLHRKAFGQDGAVKEVGRISICSDGYEFVCSTQSFSPMEKLFDVRSVGERA